MTYDAAMGAHFKEQDGYHFHPQSRIIDELGLDFNVANVTESEMFSMQFIHVRASDLLLEDDPNDL